MNAFYSVQGTQVYIFVLLSIYIYNLYYTYIVNKNNVQAIMIIAEIAFISLTIDKSLSCVLQR